jgi:glucose/arabinose dehydrogenase
MPRTVWISAVLLVVVAPALGQPPPPTPLADDPNAGPDGLRIRTGYRVNIAVPQVPGARFLEVDPAGTLYISRLRLGDIIACRDEDGDGVYERQTTFVADKPKVHGMCFRPDAAGDGAGSAGRVAAGGATVGGGSRGWLWFATDGAVYKARDTDGDLVADEVIEVIPNGTLPVGGQHLWRCLLVTGDSIYTAIGDGGNISDQTATDRQKIWRYALDGSNKRLFASGIRNTEKLLMRPGTGELWGFDHGSDNFGMPLGEQAPALQPITDLNPPDELNLYVEGGFYGHPFLVGDRIPRYEYKDRPDLHDWAQRTIAPEWKVPAHWATNGFCFIDPQRNRGPFGLPADHEGDILVACHGSWNSSTTVGYCVARVLFDDGKPYGMLKIVDALGADRGRIAARPVDCVQAYDGSILFSSDQPAGRVYRLVGATSSSGAPAGSPGAGR